MEVLSDRRVHDATCQDVGETTVITRAPVFLVVGDTNKIHIVLLCNYYSSK